jgi:3-phosphoshikimate 1-carboxyvinyltransferase
MAAEQRRLDFLVTPARAPLRGGVPVPSDKSIAHRCLILGALGSGPTEVRRFSYGGDNVSTMNVMRALGITVDDDGEGTLRVHGKGLHGLSAPAGPLDCGNSGTTMRIMTGVLAAQRFKSVLVGDASLSRRPMARVANPLRRRGAVIEGKFHATKAGEITPPLEIGPLAGDNALGECEETLAVASAQVKSALLLSGLYAAGNTWVKEPLVSRDHTERILSALGVPIRAIGPMVELDIGRFDGAFPGFANDVPGDLSAAAFLLVAGAIVPGSELTVRGTGLNPTRSGVLDFLRDAGVTLGIEPRADAMGEPVGDVHVRHGDVRGALLAGELLTRAIDEVPVLSVLAARARGVTEIADAAELRVKESDRLAAMATVLRAFGVSCEERPDGMLVEGKPEGPLKAAEVDSLGDHRIAMSAALLALVADGESRIRDVECVGTSFPKFAGTLRALGADVRVVEA